MSPPSPTIDLTALSRTDITDPIPPDTVTAALQKPPFLSIRSALNARDLGLLPSSPIKPGLVFGSGMLTHMPPTDLLALTSTYNIRRIYDLRSHAERQRAPEPSIVGVQSIWQDIARPKSDGLLEAFAINGGVDATVAGYEMVLDIYAPVFARVLRDLLAPNDNEGDGEKGAILFHCTGKDRTAVLATLLLALAGASDATIIDNYMLTRIGIEPQREVLTKALLAGLPEGTTMGTPGVREMASVKAEYMAAFLKKVRERYGGVEGYARSVLGLGKEEVERVTKVLRGEGARSEGV